MTQHSNTANSLNPATTMKSAEQIDGLNNFAFVFEQRVAWGEMDAFNHLNNVVYYRYAESARIGYLNALGLFSEGIQVVLAQSSCQYLRPVTFPDTLYIGVRTSKVGNTSMLTTYDYYSATQQVLVATAEAVLVRLDAKTHQKINWSEQERQHILGFNQSESNTIKA